MENSTKQFNIFNIIQNGEINTKVFGHHKADKELMVSTSVGQSVSKSQSIIGNNRFTQTD